MTDETHDEAADREPAVSFAELGLPSELLQAVEKIGYESASPIQAEAIPILLAGHDLIGQAQTGTGKTAAFARRPASSRCRSPRRSSPMPVT
jgi:superfamily II DNA/RNA helicase